jgi:hypothetical protein
MRYAPACRAGRLEAGRAGQMDGPKTWLMPAAWSVEVASPVALDEVLNAGRYVPQLQIAAAAQLLGAVPDEESPSQNRPHRTQSEQMSSG